MMRPHVVMPRAVAQLVHDLVDIDVHLPPKVVDAAATLDDATDGTLTRSVSQPAQPVDWLALTGPDLRRRIIDTATLLMLTDKINDATVTIATEVATAVVTALQAEADTVLDQLRPRFTEAAQAVHAAVQAGLTPGITAEAAIKLGPAAVTAYQSLPGHVAALEAVASLRINLTDVADIEPLGDAFDKGQRCYSAAFTKAAVQWGGDHTDVDKWLRLSQQPDALTLLSIADTRRAAIDNRVDHPYVGPPYSNPDATIDTARPRTFEAR